MKNIDKTKYDNTLAVHVSRLINPHHLGIDVNIPVLLFYKGITSKLKWDLSIIE